MTKIKISIKSQELFPELSIEDRNNLKMQERLIELLLNNPKASGKCSIAKCGTDCKYYESDKCYTEMLADHLLANGVVVLPYKVGDTVYAIYGSKVYECRVSQTRTFQQKNGDMTYEGNAIFEVEDLFYLDGRKEEINVAVRFYPKGTDHDCYDTREEAERALAKRKDEVSE